jgi:hypothetical protein
MAGSAREWAMVDNSNDRFAAGAQALGYMFQPRFALLKLLQMPESTSILIEKDDDLDFLDKDGTKTLASLKHKAAGDRVNNLSIDFWKSVRIWLVRYNDAGRTQSNLQFFLFTTGTVVTDSFLKHFLADPQEDLSQEALADLTVEVLTKSKNKLMIDIANTLDGFKEAERRDFLSRITIVDDSPRIADVRSLIQDQHMRVVRRDCREALFERLEGWWNETIIRLLTGHRKESITGYEVSDKLNLLADEYKSDNLPITFRGKVPANKIDTDGDDRLFVVQLREIGVSSSRIRNAILDYYRAFEQRSAWAREDLLVPDELEGYEERLIDEWGRYRDVVYERLDRDAAEEALQQAGRDLYDWADMQTGNIAALRIRERVTEPYVVRGGFHILANSRPPRIYWHPQFLTRVGALLGEAR